MTDATKNPFIGTTWVTRPYNLGTPDDKTPYFRVFNQANGDVLDSILVDQAMGGTAYGTLAKEHTSVLFAPTFGWTKSVDTFPADAAMVKAHGGILTQARLFVRTMGEGVVSPLDNPVDHYSTSESDWENAKARIYTTLFFQTADGKKNVEGAIMNAGIFGSFRFVEALALDESTASFSFTYNVYNVLNPSKVWNPIPADELSARLEAERSA